MRWLRVYPRRSHDRLQHLGNVDLPSKEMGSLLLPLKKPVRVAEGLGVRDLCHVHLRIAY